MRLVLLDRDGTLNENRPCFVGTPAELVLLPGAAAALARLNRAGLRVALVTNQAAVGRGLLSESALHEIHRQLAGTLAEAGAHLDLVLIAPDPPEAAGPRRKPGPAMLLEAFAHFQVPASEAVMIGDDLTDIAAAVAAGWARVLVRSGKGTEVEARGLPPELLPVAVTDHLAGAVDLILGPG